MGFQIEDETCIKSIGLVAAVGVVGYAALSIYALVVMAGWFTATLLTVVIGWCLYMTNHWDKQGYYVAAPSEPVQDEEEDL